MSRTYRKKKNKVKPSFYDIEYVLSQNYWEDELNSVNLNDIQRIEHSIYSVKLGQLYRVTYTQKSEHGKRMISKWHSDSGVRDFKEPGPSWFKKLYTIRPERRKSKRDLKKFISDPNYEIIFHEKYYYEYWT